MQSNIIMPFLKMRKQRTCLRPHSWLMSGPELEPRSVLSQNVILSRTVYYLPCFIPLFEGKKMLNSGKSINYQYLLSPTMIKTSMEKHRSLRHKPATNGYRQPGKVKRTFTHHVEHKAWGQQGDYKCSRILTWRRWFITNSWLRKVSKKRQGLNHKWKGGRLQVAKTWGRILLTGLCH